jgi:hypothetical protein
MKKSTAPNLRSAARTEDELPPLPVGADVQVPDPDANLKEEIARLAYSCWKDRGGQGGSPEEDWFRAEAEIRSRSARTVSAAM